MSYADAVRLPVKLTSSLSTVVLCCLASKTSTMMLWLTAYSQLAIIKKTIANDTLQNQQQ